MEKLQWFSYALLLASAQGCILILVLRKIPNANKRANLHLSVMIGLVVSAMIGRLAFDPKLFTYFPHFVIVSDVIIFLFGPFFYFYIRAVLLLPPLSIRSKLLHFLPAFAHFVSMIPQIILDKDTYIHMMMVERTPWLYAVWLSFEGMAILLNFCYLYLSYSIVKKHKSKPLIQTYSKYLHTILILLLICLVGWAQGYMLYFFKVRSLLSFAGSTLGWLLPTGITYFLGYLTAVKPQLFKIPALPKEKYQNSSLVKSDLEKHQELLEELMVTQLPYINPNLTLQSLGAMLMLKPAQLSQIINECYHKNFFDFINTYRLQHFIRLASLEEHQHKTLLGIALEAGFNSKSTFNRAFKKEYKVAPTTYLKQMKVPS